MNIKQVGEHMLLGTKVVAAAIVALLFLHMLVTYVPWLLLAFSVLWLVWFVGYMLS